MTAAGSTSRRIAWVSPRAAVKVAAVYDAIVVGARCTGAATAMLLARRGFDVLLVDRARFPSDIPHGHFIRAELALCAARASV
jgi:choline dehydrogenase-like flavoprotein